MTANQVFFGRKIDYFDFKSTFGSKTDFVLNFCAKKSDTACKVGSFYQGRGRSKFQAKII